MALQFDSGPYLELFRMRQAQEQAERPDLNATVTQPLLQGLQMMNDNSRQKQLMALQQQKMAQEAEQQGIENRFKYGAPIDPNIMTAAPAPTMGSSTQFGGKPMPVATESSLMQQFNKWRAGGMKPGEAQAEFVPALGQDERKQFYETANQKPIDEDMQAAEIKLKEARADYLSRPQKEKGPNFNQENRLRTEFLGQSKDFNDTAASYQRLVNSSQNPSAAGDLALIFNYMKMLDPGSTVREGEFANAAASGSYGDRFQAAAQKIVSGQRLDDSMRQDFMNRATDLYQGQLSRHKQREGEYQGLAKSYGGDPSRVTPNLATPVGGYQAQAPAATPRQVGRFRIVEE